MEYYCAEECDGREGGTRPRPSPPWRFALSINIFIPLFLYRTALPGSQVHPHNENFRSRYYDINFMRAPHTCCCCRCNIIIVMIISHIIINILHWCEVRAEPVSYVVLLLLLLLLLCRSRVKSRAFNPSRADVL